MLIKKIIRKPFLLLAIGLVLGIFIGNNIATNNSTKATKTVLRESGVSEKVNTETIKNDIKNDIELNIDKLKKTDSLNININQDPKNDQKPSNTINKTACGEGKICIDINDLTRKQKRKHGLN